MSASDAIAAFAAVSVFIVGLLTWHLQRRSNKSTDIAAQLQERNQMMTEVQEERDHTAAENTQLRIEIAQARQAEQAAYTQLAQSRSSELQTRSDLVDAQNQLHGALITIAHHVDRVEVLKTEVTDLRAENERLRGHAP